MTMRERPRPDMNDVDFKAAQASNDKLEQPLPPAEAVAGPQETKTK